MVGALTFLLTGCLLQGALCGNWEVHVPSTIEVVRGSCVTIPCSFDIHSSHEKNLDDTCKAVWKQSGNKIVFDSSEINQIKGELKGILKEKTCTTSLNDVSEESSSYSFRLECNNELKWNFDSDSVRISVKDALSRPSLTSSTLKMKEGTSVTLTCSAPAPCLSHPPTLTWTPKLGDSHETLRENEDKTKVQTSVLTFTASHLHHRQKISCTAVYKKLHGSTYTTPKRSLTANVSYSPKSITVSVSPSGPVPENSNVTLTCSSDANPPVKNYSWYRADGDQDTLIGTGRVLNTAAIQLNSVLLCKAENDRGVGGSDKHHIDVQFPPQILPSSHCIITSYQVNCSCETVGNPSPTLLWYLDGLPVIQSSKFTLTESQTGTTLRSIITMNNAEKDLSTLFCNSFNSLGSASKQFCVNSLKISAEKEQISLLVFITTVVALLLLVCILLFVIRFQRNQLTGEVNTVASGQHVLKKAEGDIYANINVLKQGDSELDGSSRQNCGADDVEGASGSSEKNEEENDIIYSRVIWNAKTKNKSVEDAKFYQEEEKCKAGDVCRNFLRDALEMNSLYAEVKTRSMRKKQSDSA